MKSKFIFPGNLKLILTWIAVFVGFALLLILNNRVSSQSEKEMRLQNGFSNQQNNSKMHNDRIQELIDLLESNNEAFSPSTKIEAIKELGNARAKKAIPSLIKFLGYEDKAEIATTKPETINGITVFTEQNILLPSERYPAIGALIQIGQPALPVLLKVIESEDSNSVKSQNALYTIQQIFVEDQLKAVLYLEKAVTESKSANGSKRLKIAAQKTRKKWDDLQHLPN